jgi:hypothetical protein
MQKQAGKKNEETLRGSKLCRARRKRLSLGTGQRELRRGGSGQKLQRRRKKEAKKSALT